MANPKLGRIEAERSLFDLLMQDVEDIAIFALDADGLVASWNAGAEHIHGYADAEAIGLHYAAFHTEEERGAGKPAALLGAAAERGRVEDEGWRVRKDGSRFWASAVITALRAPDGALTGFAKLTRDLTEERAAAAELRARQRQLADTQALAGLGSWEWEVESDRVTWTDELYRIYGLDPSSFGATFAAYLERVHPEDRDGVRAEIETAFQKGGLFDFEERIVRPDGELRVLRSRGRAVQDDEGRTIRLQGACLDITELKEAEAQALELARLRTAREAAESSVAGLRFLVQSSELLASSLDYNATLRNVAELAVPGIADWCAVDLVENGDTLRRVAVAHRDPERVELARQLGERYPPRRDAQTGGWHVVDTGETEFYPEIPDELLEKGAEDAEHLALLRELGLRSAVAVPLAGRTGVLGALTLVQAESGRRVTESDVWLVREMGRQAALAIENARLHRELESQYYRLEEQTEELQTQAHHLEDLMSELEVANEDLRRRTEEAEDANRAKADFLAAMSHELRTPLNAIFGYAELLDLGLHGPVTTAQREALDRIKRNQRALLALINDVLNFAKLEAGKLDLRISAVPVAEVIADLEAVVAPQVQARTLQYECRACGPEVRMMGERERIEQILLNLLTNAIKFTHPGGSITLSVEADPSAVRLSVRDTGSGISPEKLHTVFDPFVQIDRSPADSRDRGVGLGLAISRDLALAMGGTLSAESVVGEGSTFTLVLPRED